MDSFNMPFQVISSVKLFTTISTFKFLFVVVCMYLHFVSGEILFPSECPFTFLALKFAIKIVSSMACNTVSVQGIFPGKYFATFITSKGLSIMDRLYVYVQLLD